MKKILCISLVASFLTTAHAATIVNWTLDGFTNPDASPVADPVSASKASSDYGEVIISDMSLDNLRWSATGGYSGNNNRPDGHLSLTNWQTSGNLGTPANYLTFTLSVGAGSSWSLEGLSMSVYRNGAGAPANGTWEYSLDGGTNYFTLGTPSLTLPNNSGTDQGYSTINFLSSPLELNNITSGEITFRFSATNGGTTTGNLHIRDITVNGSLIPEPAVFSLGFLGLASLLLRRRR